MTTKNTILTFAGLALATAFTLPGHAQTASDVSCTKCVDTSDIANDAITSGRIKDGSVTNADLAFDAITSNRIRNGTVSNADLAPDAITGSRIKNGSVTNVDIKANTITGSRIKNGSLTGLDLADGTITSAKLASNALFQNIYVVRPDVFEPVAGCDRIRAILAGFPDDNADRALIRLEPGVYDCSTVFEQPMEGGTGLSGLIMKPFVDIEGSGQGVTFIIGDTANDGEGVVQIAANSELRFLTVDNVASEGSHALYAPAGGSIAFVTLDPADTGIQETIDCTASELTPALVVRSSIIRSSDEATYNCENGIVFVASQLDVANGPGFGSQVCHASFDGAYAPLDLACQSSAPMRGHATPR